MRPNPYGLCALVAALLVSFLLAGCAGLRPPPEADQGPRLVGIEQERAADLARRLDPASQNLEDWRELEPGILASLEYVDTRPREATAATTASGEPITWARLRASLVRLLELLPRLGDDPGLLAREFDWYAFAPDPLLTGYYAPEIRASLKRAPGYPHPVYGVPEDLRTLDLGDFHPRWEGEALKYRMQDGWPVPYHDRFAIDVGGVLAGRGLEVAWATDLYDIYNLQVQGSGVLRLPDDSTRFILYGDKNGRAFTSVARIMLRQGLLESSAINKQGIKKALNDLPYDKRVVLTENESYVFFRVADEKPLGAMGRRLTPRVSLATDPRFLPLGSLLAFGVDIRMAEGEEPVPVHGLGLAQDTGGLIKGAHLDYYCGIGDGVEYMAFHIKTSADVHLLLARTQTGESP
jgi:membrane-bound lytic murein transglycosylase A